jgi:hypothetical protein
VWVDDPQRPVRDDAPEPTDLVWTRFVLKNDAELLDEIDSQLQILDLIHFKISLLRKPHVVDLACELQTTPTRSGRETKQLKRGDRRTDTSVRRKSAGRSAD